MNERGIIFTLCLLGLFTLSPLFCASQEPPAKKDSQVAQPDAKKETVKETPQSLPVQKKDDLEEIKKSIDRLKDSFEATNRIATLMGVIITAASVILGIFTIVVAVATAYGLIQINKWKKTRKAMEEDARSIKAYRETLEREKNEAQERIPATIDLNPSVELKKEVEEIRRKIDTLQAMGSELTSEDYKNKAQDFYYNEHYNKALEAYDKALELKPNNPDTWQDKGMTLHNLGRYKEALRAYDEALKFKPDFAQAWYNMACSYSLMKNKSDALNSLAQTIALDPKFKEEAKADEDFGWLLDDLEFKRFVGEKRGGTRRPPGKDAG